MSDDDRWAAWPDEHQLLEKIREIRSACDDLELGVLDRDPALLRRGVEKRSPWNVLALLRAARKRRRDGYSPGARGDDVTTVPLSRESDEETESVPSVADPVGNAVVANMDTGAGPQRRAIFDVLRQLNAATGALHKAVRCMVKASPSDKQRSVGQPGCRSCARIGRWMPRYRGKAQLETERCSWCYGWWSEWGAEPPLKILRAHHDGKRVSTRLIEEIMGKDALRQLRARAAATKQVQAS